MSVNIEENSFGILLPHLQHKESLFHKKRFPHEQLIIIIVHLLS
nr:MAG TPA: hypothetical protein [Caudoviricetes sp.]